MEARALAPRNEPEPAGRGQDIEQIKRQLDMLDQRLDNIDSVITAAVERVMKQPVTLNIVCPHCHKAIEIALIGSEKPAI